MITKNTPKKAGSAPKNTVSPIVSPITESKEYDIKAALSDYVKSGSSLRAPTAKNGGYSPVELDASGTKNIIRTIVSLYFREAAKSKAKIEISDFLPKFKALLIGEKGIAFRALIRKLTSDPTFKNEVRLYGDYLNKVNKGLLRGFKVYESYILPENYLLNESEIKNLR